MYKIKSDETYMRRALQLASKGSGQVSPNPMVGAVIVKNGEIIGEGYHQKFGRVHAEVNAIESTNEPVRGATLYCTLEPCCHIDKKTPPCAQRIVKEGIVRVVIAGQDPNPKVNGMGIALMKKAGIAVTSGIMNEENRELNRFFFKYMITGLPYITVKIAQTLDGKIALIKNEQTWITNQKSQKLVHRWRDRYDAVLVGANTIRIDDPELTVRKIRGRNPKRIILSGSLTFEKPAKVFTDKYASNTTILTTVSDKTQIYNKWSSSGVNIFQIAASGNVINSIVRKLGDLEIASVLVEGGRQVFSQFIASGLTDEIQIFIAPKVFGRGITAFVNGSDLILEKYYLYKTTRLDSDILLTFRKKGD